MRRGQNIRLLHRNEQMQMAMQANEWFVLEQGMRWAVVPLTWPDLACE